MSDGYGLVSNKHHPYAIGNVTDNRLSTPCDDTSGVLWIGSRAGLQRFDRPTGTFRHFTPKPITPGSTLSGCVCAVSEESNGTLWVGTRDGVYPSDGETGEFSSLRHESADPGSVARNTVQVI